MRSQCKYKILRPLVFAGMLLMLHSHLFAQEMEFYNLYFDGNSCFSKKQYEKAISYYNKAMAIHADKDFIYFNRGNSKCALKNYKDALADYNKTIALNNKYAEAYYQRALVKFVLGDKEGGCADLKTAKKLELTGVNNTLKRYCK